MDVHATIARLFVYPVKSCAGVELPEATLTETGLEFDRAWMVVDEQGVFVTQRELPRMALVRPELKTFEMVLRAPGMLALHIALEKVEHPVQATVWKDTVAAFDMGDVAAQWFTDFLNTAADGRAVAAPRKLRLVRFNPEHRRLSSLKWTDGAEALNQFSDGYPVLVVSEAALEGLNQRLLAAGEAAVAMERFRPNLVLSGLEAHDEDSLDILHITTSRGVARLRMVKPCPRCPIPNIDPTTALSTPAVGDMLQTYRQVAVVDGAVAFGMNAIVLDGMDMVLQVGQTATADYKFD